MQTSLTLCPSQGDLSLSGDVPYAMHADKHMNSSNKAAEHTTLNDQACMLVVCGG